MTCDLWQTTAREAREGASVSLGCNDGKILCLTHDGKRYRVRVGDLTLDFQSVKQLVEYFGGQVAGRAEKAPGVGVPRKPRRHQRADPDPRPRAERKHARNAGFKARLRRRAGKGKK